MRFPDGAVLCVGTITCDDQIHQAVYLSYTSAGATAPGMELELPPASVEIIIRQLQEYANQARFVNGARVLDYPEPHPVTPGGAPRRPRKAGRKQTTSGQADAPASRRPRSKSPASPDIPSSDPPQTASSDNAG
jgi:hypothetical protein